MKFEFQLPAGEMCKNVDAGKNEELGNNFTVDSIAEAAKAVDFRVRQRLITPALEKLQQNQSAEILGMTITPVTDAEKPSPSDPNNNDSNQKIVAALEAGMAAMVAALNK